MSDLNDLVQGGNTSQPIGLDDLVTSAPLPQDAPPVSAIRNKAATVTMLSGNQDNAVDTYHALMQEGQEGGSQIMDTLSKAPATANRSQDFSALTGLLADKNVSLDAKQAALKGFDVSKFLSDRPTALQSNMLSAPSQGESEDAGNARISVADQLSKMYDARETIQGLANNAVAKFPDRTVLGAFADAFSSVATQPLEGIRQNNIADSLDPSRGQFGITNIVKHIDTLLRPGATKQGFVNTLNSLPTDQKVAYAQTFVKAVQNNSGLVFGSDNQEEAYNALQLLSKDGYSGIDQFADNLWPVLSLLGIRGTASGIANVGDAVSKQLEKRGASTFNRVEPSIAPSNTADQGTGAFNPKARPAQEAEDVPFTDMNGQGPGVTDVPFTETPRSPAPQGVGPNRQLPNPVPKLTQEPQSLNNRRGLIGGEQPPLLENPVKSIAQAEEKVNTELAVVRQSPATPGEMANHVNPEQSRNMYDVSTQQGDAATDTAGAFYNASPDQVVLNAKAGQVAAPRLGQGIDTRTNDIDQVARHAAQDEIPPEQFGIKAGNVGDMYTPTERAAANANVSNQFRNAAGIVPNDSMASVKLEGSTFHISQVYEAPTGSWSNAKDALDQTKFALRNQGVLDSDLTLLAKNGNQHVPVKYTEGMPEGDYKVAVNVERDINNFDVQAWDKLDVKRNWFDRFPQLVSDNHGSLNSMLLDAAGSLHPTITGAAVNVDYQAAKLDKILVGKLKEAADEFRGLSDVRFQKAMDYIREANQNRIPFDVTDLTARGFNAKEVGALQKWKNFWDIHYQLENADRVKTLTNRGFKVVDNGATKMFGRPVGKGAASTFYDADSGVVRGWRQGEADAVYNNGGTLAELVRPISINGQTVSHVMVPNTTKTYLRTLRDTDRVLNKLDGYFQRTYKAPIFVDKVKLDSAGRVTERSTVAVAGDTPTAEGFRKRMSVGSQDSYVIRHDVKSMSDFNTTWDLDSAGGRVAQRHRGQLLVDADHPNQLGNSHVDNPMDSAVRTANSIANRVVSRPMIEATKERFVQQYGHLLKDGQYPITIKDIGAVGQESTKEIADARTTFMYIQKLEHGYSNTLDKGYKAFINYVGDLLGKAGLGTAERAVRSVADASPNRLAKRITSEAYITLNPLRQIIIQPWQATRMFSYNPIGSANGNIAGLAGQWLLEKAGMSSAQNHGFIKWIDESGLLQAVDKHTLINGSIQFMADNGRKWSTIANAPANALNLVRKLGFDAGESANRLMHMAAVYDRYARLGRNVADKAVQARMTDEASALMGDMTRAGEMPYNQSTMGAIFQFLQAPHKILTQSLNRRIDIGSRLRLLAGDMVFHGLAPATTILSWLGLDKLRQDHPEFMDWMAHGIVSMAANHMIQAHYPDSGKVDFNGLDPRGLDMVDGWVKLLQNGPGDMTIADILSKTPSIGLVQGNRIGTATRSVFRFMNPNPEWDGGNPTTFLGMMNDIASITSGWSNANKAQLILDQHQRLDQYGRMIDPGATTPQAIAQLFGFGSQTQQDLYNLSQSVGMTDKQLKADVKQKVKDIEQYYTSKLGQGNSDVEWMTGVVGAAMNIYKDNPRAMQLVQQQIGYDVTPAQLALQKQFIEACGIPTVGAIHDKIDQVPGMSDADKQRLHQICNDMASIREHYKEEK